MVKLDFHTVRILSIFFWTLGAGSSVAAASGFLNLNSESSMVSPQSTNGTVELLLSTESWNTQKHQPFWEFDLTASQISSPTNYAATPIAINKVQRYILPFNTTLNGTSSALEVDWLSGNGWQVGGEITYSFQSGVGTPNTSSILGSLILGHHIEYHRSQDPEDFQPSWDWKFVGTAGNITADSFSVISSLNQTPPYGTTTQNTVGATALRQSALSMEFSWSPAFWLSTSVGYVQFAYDSDPNILAPAKSPKRGTPTSLEAFEDSGSLTFHLTDSWDFETRVAYNVAATVDQTPSDTETYSLTYFGSLVDLGVGYEHQNSSATPLDSGVGNLRIHF